MIVIKDNRFERNMAYFAGNAFYIYNLMKSTDEEEKDYLQFCGAGILIDSNVFEDNIGMKRHNGGAGVLRCKRTAYPLGNDECRGIDCLADYVQGMSSGLYLKERNATDEELEAWGAED